MIIASLLTSFRWLCIIDLLPYKITKASMSMNQQVPKLWIFVFLAVVATLVGIYVTSPKPQTIPVDTDPLDELPESDRAMTFEQMLVTGKNAIYLENQASGSAEVTIGFVVLSDPGYVVIFDNNDGVPGEIIGYSALLQKGGEHIVMRADTPLEEDALYFAMLYHDNGDGYFSAVTDTQVLDTENSVVLMTFIAQEGVVPEAEPVTP